ncbi:pyridoxamine 5'-phosphate oxidase family protein [Massilia sp. W12]|uniref:pyridoxamine 5'-phosphate oxidase family protein n=1 Tax=Massilia sp. W12 TaxID=3126507 RepID=UPI0030D2C2DD
MDQAAKAFALEVLDQARDLTLATIRPDGYPQATTVNFVHEDLTIYVGVDKNSQKVSNVRHCDKVSLTANGKYTDWQHVHGLSMGARATIVEDAAEAARVEAALDKKYPEIGEWAHSDARHSVVFIRITPGVISILNYEKGVGHTDLEQV